MKTLLKTIFVVAAIFGTYTRSYANEAIKVTTTINNVKKGSLISVANAKGKVIYNGQVNYNANLTRVFDFTQLKDGIYTLEITKGFEIEINTIAVKNNLATFLDANRKIIHRPSVRNKDETVFVSKLSLNADKIEVELYFEGELILSETVIGEKILKRVYKLDKTLPGNYAVVIKSQDKVFVDNFRI